METLTKTRRTMPEGVTKDAVEKVIWDTLSTEHLALARSSKVPVFTYSIVGRKSDRTGMYKVKETLAGLFKLAGTSVIDKTVLLDACEKFNTKSGGVMSQSSAPVETQAYALKAMLMDVGRTKRSSTTGLRLAPWLKELTDLVENSEGIEFSQEPPSPTPLNVADTAHAAADSPAKADSPASTAKSSSKVVSPAKADSPASTAKASTPRHKIYCSVYWVRITQSVFLIYTTLYTHV